MVIADISIGAYAASRAVDSVVIATLACISACTVLVDICCKINTGLFTMV